MAYFVVSYDLVKENSSFDYQPLWDALDQLDSVKCLLSVYMVAIDWTQKDLSTYLHRFIDGNDRLMVWQFYERPSYQRALKGTNDWLARHFG